MANERVTVSKMKSQLDSLVEEHGDKYIMVGEYYIGEKFNTKSDDSGLFNEMIYQGIHYSDIKLTPEQDKYIQKKTNEYYDSLSDEDKKIMDSLKDSLVPSPDDKKKKQIEQYIKYLDGLKSENRINEEEYQKMLTSIH